MLFVCIGLVGAILGEMEMLIMIPIAIIHALLTLLLYRYRHRKDSGYVQVRK